jgi:hypothetical protein
VSGAAWPRCFQPCFQAGDRPLTPSVAPRPAWISRRDPAYRRASAGSVAPSSKGATSTVQSAFHRQVPPKFMLSHVLPGSCFRMIPLRHVSSGGEPATSLVALPPRSRLPTLLRPLTLSRSRARPEAAPEAIHPWSPRAARRLSISATDTIREHNCAIVQTPPTTPVVAHVRSFLHSTHLGS